MNDASTNLMIFLGRFHPLLIHLPIGGLIVICGLELAARFARFRKADQNNHLIIGFVAVVSFASAMLGLVLAQSGGYDNPLVKWHKWAGVAVAVGCTVTFLLSGNRRSKAYYGSLALTFLILLIACHLGGSITHGSDFLSRYAPAALRPLLGGVGPSRVLLPTNSSGSEAEFFDQFVQPVLNERCSSCHGATKQKGGLRLDSLAAALKGGDNGPALIAGKPDESEMVRRMLLPLDAENHMPPPAKPQPSRAEIRLMELWIGGAGPETPASP